MVAAAMLGGIALVMLQLSKSQNTQTVQSKISLDLAQLKTDIQSYLSNPAHCNVNFKGLTSAGITPVAIYACTEANLNNCQTRGPGANIAARIPVTNGAVWTPPYERVRVSAVTIAIASATPTAPSTAVITTATLNVTIQTKDMTGVKTLPQVLGFTAPVVFNGTIVTGCPKNLNSTIPF
jgi:hypothetical protein